MEAADQERPEERDGDVLWNKDGDIEYWAIEGVMSIGRKLLEEEMDLVEVWV